LSTGTAEEGEELVVPTTKILDYTFKVSTIAVIADDDS